MKFQEKCPHCNEPTVTHAGVTYTWYEEDEDGANAINPTGFFCSDCYGPAGEEETPKTETSVNPFAAQPIEEETPVVPTPDFSDTIQIEFMFGKFSYQKENDSPVTGLINGQSHQTKLLRRAMEVAKLEGKKLMVANGMESVTFQQVTEKDIKIHCKEQEQG